MCQPDVLRPVAARLPAGKAQPLYERALAIYEKVYGPDHPEVAHTLTDLAVLHLESVSREYWAYTRVSAINSCLQRRLLTIAHTILFCLYMFGHFLCIT
jgi:hypothetical protein